MFLKMFDLQKFRIDKKILQKDLANLFNCRQSNISMIEKHKKLTDEQLKLLVDKYGETDINKYHIIDISDILSEPHSEYKKEDKMHDVELLKEKLADYDRRFGLINEFLKEKDERIKDLKEQMQEKKDMIEYLKKDLERLKKKCGEDMPVKNEANNH